MSIEETSIQSTTALSEHSGGTMDLNHVAKSLGVNAQALEANSPPSDGTAQNSVQEPQNHALTAQYASIIEALLQHFEQDHSQISLNAQADGQKLLLRLLARIPGCVWLRGQFNSTAHSHTSVIPSSQPASKATRSQNGQCTACQSEWPQADRFCRDVANQARDQQLEWHEVEGLIDVLAQRIAGGTSSAPKNAKFDGLIDYVKDGASSSANVPDQEILTSTAFDAFTIQNYRLILRYFRFRGLDFEDAQDLTQSAFLILWGRRHEARDPKAFLKGVARHQYFAFLRARKAGISLTDTNLESEAVNPDRPPENEEAANAMTRSNLKAELLAGMDSLSQNQRKVIRLIYLEGLSLRQTADRLGIKASSVQMHESRAIASLRRHSGSKLG